MSSTYSNTLCGCTKDMKVCLLALCIPFAYHYFHAKATTIATKTHHHGDSEEVSFMGACFCELFCIIIFTFINNYSIK